MMNAAARIAEHATNEEGAAAFISAAAVSQLCLVSKLPFYNRQKMAGRTIHPCASDAAALQFYTFQPALISVVCFRGVAASQIIAGVRRPIKL